MGLKITVINHRKISEPQLIDDADSLNHQEMLDLVLAPSAELPLFIGNCGYSHVMGFIL